MPQRRQDLASLPLRIAFDGAFNRDGWLTGKIATGTLVKEMSRLRAEGNYSLNELSVDGRVRLITGPSFTIIK